MVMPVQSLKPHDRWRSDPRARVQLGSSAHCVIGTLLTALERRCVDVVPKELRRPSELLLSRKWLPTALRKPLPAEERFPGSRMLLPIEKRLDGSRMLLSLEKRLIG